MWAALAVAFGVGQALASLGFVFLYPDWGGGVVVSATFAIAAGALVVFATGAAVALRRGSGWIWPIAVAGWACALGALIAQAYGLLYWIASIGEPGRTPALVFVGRDAFATCGRTSVLVQGAMLCLGCRCRLRFRARAKARRPSGGARPPRRPLR